MYGLWPNYAVTQPFGRQQQTEPFTESTGLSWKVSVIGQTICQSHSSTPIRFFSAEGLIKLSETVSSERKSPGSCLNSFAAVIKKGICSSHDTFILEDYLWL